MSIVDELVENLVERNAIRLNGTLSLALIDGGIKITGQISSTLRDQKRTRTSLTSTFLSTPRSRWAKSSSPCRLSGEPERRT